MKRIKFIVVIIALLFAEQIIAEVVETQIYSINEPANIEDIHEKEFLTAAYRGNIEKVKALLEKGVNINAIDMDEDQDTALHYAAWKGHADIVKLLIDEKADINVLDRSGMTPLHFAVRIRRNQIIEMLLDANAEVNIKGPSGRHVLDCVCNIYAFPEITELLVDAGAQIDIDEGDLQMSLQKAVWCKQIQEARRLIEDGADAKKDPDLLIRAAMYKDSEMLRLLLNAGADVNAMSCEGDTALFWAVYYNRKDNIQILLDKKADINAHNRGTKTPLRAAVSTENKPLVTFLIQRGADVDIKSEDSPLFMAVLHNEIEIVKLLLKKVNTKALGDRFVYQAVYNKSEEMVKTLLDAGCATNPADSMGETPLHSASRSGNVEIVKMLLQAGANLNVLTEYGGIPLNDAAFCGNEEVVKLLLEAGSDVNSVCCHGITPLFSAAKEGKTKVVQILLDAGADVNAITWNGTTSLFAAVERGDVKTVSVLLAYKGDVNLGNEKGKILLLENARKVMYEKKSRVEIARMLIAAGVDVNATDKNGWSVLHEIVWRWRYNEIIIPMLIKAGADVNAISLEGDTALHSCNGAMRVEVLRMFLAAGFNEINTANNDGQTLLHQAVSNGSEDTIRLLIESGADIYAKNKRGVTPLDFAQGSKKPESVLSLFR